MQRALSLAYALFLLGSASESEQHTRVSLARRERTQIRCSGERAKRALLSFSMELKERKKAEWKE